MSKRSLAIVFLFVCLTTITVGQYKEGANYVGPAIGLSFLGSTPQFGINFEHAMKMDFGLVGIGGIFRYWSYSEDYLFAGKWKYTDILIGAQGNYHFVMDNDKLDPWVGLVLAYDAGSVTWDGPGGNFASPTHGGLFLGAHAGGRYWLSPTMALHGRFGFGTLSYSALDIGIDFKF